METKICLWCKNDLSIKMFHKKNGNTTSTCKKCRREKYNPRKSFGIIENLVGEVWKEVVGFEKLYEVSSYGRVKSLERVVDHKTCGEKFIHNRLLTVKTGTKGYAKIALLKNGKYYYFSTHRLTALAFIPNPENKPEVNHINGIKTDNRVENLEWATTSENQIHAIKNGLKKVTKGDDCSWSKLTEKDVLEIRAIGKTIKGVDLSKKYNVSKALISLVLNKKIWEHI